MIKINPKAEKLYPVICSWCGEIVSWKDVENSHTICESCSEKELEAMRAMLAD
jgi:formylmethanofuran dehydrogenase subunit E